MKDYSYLFSYSNFTGIHPDEVFFVRFEGVEGYNDGILASVWLHLGKWQPIQQSTLLPLSEADDIKAWCEDKPNAWYFGDDEQEFCRAEVGMCDLMMATADGSVSADFWTLYEARRRRYNELVEIRRRTNS